MACKVLSNSSTSVEIQVPPAAVSGLVIVQVPGGTAKSGFRLKVLGPKVVQLSPDSGAVGSTVIIHGTSLDGVTKVRFAGRVAAHIVAVSNKAVTVTVPKGAKSGLLLIESPQGKVSSPRFDVTG